MGIAKQLLSLCYNLEYRLGYRKYKSLSTNLELIVICLLRGFIKVAAHSYFRRRFSSMLLLNDL